MHFLQLTSDYNFTKILIYLTNTKTFRFAAFGQFCVWRHCTFWCKKKTINRGNWRHLESLACRGALCRAVERGVGAGEYKVPGPVMFWATRSLFGQTKRHRKTKTFFLLLTRFWVENRTSADVMTFFWRHKRGPAMVSCPGALAGSWRPWLYVFWFIVFLVKF